MIGFFLVLIEIISKMIRPLTLMFRLAANMTAGHIILSLISGSVKLGSMKLGGALMITSAFTIFEMGVCLIHAYIFTLLLILYSEEVPM